ncbi:MAG: hypothetical protein JRG71_11925 [Deltaproteobacteria bacterium]|nr:hypothetical protein [Deltaproteobacteria bacterium]
MKTRKQKKLNSLYSGYQPKNSNAGPASTEFALFILFALFIKFLMIITSECGGVFQ